MGEAAAQLVVEQADELGVERDLGAAATQVGDEPEQAAGSDRREPEHDDVGEPDVGGEPDRVRVPGTRRIARGVGRHRLDGEAVGLDHPLDLLGVRDVEVGELHRRRPYRRPRRYRHRRRHVPVPAHPALDRLPPPGHRRHRGDGQPRVLAAAPARRAPGVQRRGQQPHRPAARAARRRGDRAPTSGPARVALGRGDAAPTCPTSSSSSSTARRAASPATSSSHRCSSTTGGSCSSSAASSRSAQTAAAAPAGEVDIVGRLRRPQERRRGQLSDQRTGELTEAQRVDIDRLAPQLPGDRRADVRRAGVVGPGRGRPVPAAGRRARARPRARTCPTPCSGSSSRCRRRRLGARRAQVDQRPPNGFATQPPPHRPRQSPQHSRHRPADHRRGGAVDAQVRRPHVDGQVEEGVEERRQLVRVEAAAAPPGRSRAGAASRRSRRRPHRVPRRDRCVGRRRRSPPRPAARPAATPRRSSRWPGGCSFGRRAERHDRARRRSAAARPSGC